MKIQETIERDCCSPDDLKPYLPEVSPKVSRGHKYKFCVHCGQLWKWERSPGEMDYGWEKAIYDID